jgi:hypothetical protein
LSCSLLRGSQALPMLFEPFNAEELPTNGSIIPGGGQGALAKGTP